METGTTPVARVEPAQAAPDGIAADRIADNLAAAVRSSRVVRRVHRAAGADRRRVPALRAGRVATTLATRPTVAVAAVVLGTTEEAAGREAAPHRRAVVVAAVGATT